MLKCIPDDKDRLNYFLRLAKNNSQSQKPTDILISLIKVAAEKSIDSVQAEINYISSGPGDDGYKLGAIKKVLEDNLYVIAQDVLTRTDSTEDRQSEVIAYILGQQSKGEKWVDIAPKNLLKGVPIRKMIHHLLHEAQFFENKQKQRARERSTSLDSGEESGWQNEATTNDQPFAEQEEESTQEMQVMNLEKMLREKNSPYLNIFLGQYKNKLESIISLIDQSNDNSERLNLMANFDKEMQNATSATNVKYKDTKRFSKNPIALLDEEFNKIKPQDELINNIFNATDPGGKFLYELPLMFRKYLGEHPDFAKLLFRTGLESMLYLRLKKILGIRVPKKVNEGINNRHNLSLGELWHSSLNKAIDETVADPTLQEKFKKLAISSLMSENEYKSGLRPVTDFYAPLVHAGHFMNVKNQYGNNFANIPPEEQKNIIANLVNKAHPMYEGSLNSPLPHVTPKRGSPRLFDVHDFDKINRKPEEIKAILHNEMLNRFNNAQQIAAGKKYPGGLMDPKEDIVANNFQSLILKYALKN